jgi:hypothetical protein
MRLIQVYGERAIIFLVINKHLLTFIKVFFVRARVDSVLTRSLNFLIYLSFKKPPNRKEKKVYLYI